SDSVNILDRLHGIHNALFQHAGRIIDGVLHDERKTVTTHLLQMAEERTGVLGPEDKSINVVRKKRDRLNLLRISVPRLAIPGAQTVDEPVAVKRRYVGFVARRDNHGLLRW